MEKETVKLFVVQSLKQVGCSIRRGSFGEQLAGIQGERTREALFLFFHRATCFVARFLRNRFLVRPAKFLSGKFINCAEFFLYKENKKNKIKIVPLHNENCKFATLNM